MNILKCLILFCIVYITITQAKFYGVEYQDIKCSNSINKLCSVYKIYELGQNKNVYKLDYANYQSSLGKDFKPYELIISGDFIEGYFKMDKVYRVMVHPDRVFDYSNNDKFFIMSSSDTINQINTSNVTMSGINSIFNTYKDEIPKFQNDWFIKKVSNGGAVFTTISNHINNGAGQVQVDYAWISIPDVPICPKQNDVCQFPFVLQPTYDRNDDRCIVFKGCIRIFKNPLCVLDVDLKGCPSGYKKVSYLGNDGCQKVYCDPSFI